MFLHIYIRKDQARGDSFRGRVQSAYGERCHEDCVILNVCVDEPSDYVESQILFQM